MKWVVAARLPVPFCLRLPPQLFLSWDPEASVCGILSFRRLGTVSFSNGWTPPPDPSFRPEMVIDAYAPPPQEIPAHGMCMVCKTSDEKTIPSLLISTGPRGGFSELRGYSDMIVYVVVENQLGTAEQLNVRVFKALNRFLDVYRAVTQDPYVHRLDPALDVFLVAYRDAIVPAHLDGSSVQEILSRLGDVQHPEGGDRYRFHYRLNTLEDLYPGPILEPSILQEIESLAPQKYELPLHYELLFKAQEELKKRRYHIAVLEAETAFEVYIAQTLLAVAVHNGEPQPTVLAAMADYKKLQLLNRRILKLDAAITEHRRAQGLTAMAAFKGSPEYVEWDARLYKPRNEIIHGGRRAMTFTEARDGIEAGKKAILAIEARIPALAHRVQIAAGVGHLQNTAGRLQW